MRDTLVAVAVVIIVMAIFAGFPIIYRLGYRQGQIRALTGEVEYELVEQGNTAMKWRQVHE